MHRKILGSLLALICLGLAAGPVKAGRPAGTLKWTFNTAGTINSTPALGPDGTIYVGSDNKLFAVNADGTQKWVSYTSVATLALGGDGTIYAGSGSKLYAFSPVDGSVKWIFTLGGADSSTPAAGPDSTIYVGAADGLLYAVYGRRVPSGPGSIPGTNSILLGD